MLLRLIVSLAVFGRSVSGEETSPPPPPSPPPESSSEDPPPGAIAGTVITIFVLLIGAYLCFRRQRRRRRQLHNSTHDYNVACIDQQVPDYAYLQSRRLSSESLRFAMEPPRSPSAVYPRSPLRSPVEMQFRGVVEWGEGERRVGGGGERCSRQSLARMVQVDEGNRVEEPLPVYVRPPEYGEEIGAAK